MVNRLLSALRATRPSLPWSVLAGSVLCLVLGAAALPARAGSNFEVSPIRVDLTHAAPVATIRVVNRDSEPVVIQQTLVSWTQEGGENVYEATTAIISSPPIFTLAAGETQVVRLGLVEPVDTGVEQAFRAFLQEVPPAPTGDGQTVRIAMRVSIPVFVAPAGTARPALDWTLRHHDGDGLWLGVANKGNVHVLVNQVRIEGDAGFGYEAIAHKYALPGSTIAWRLDGDAPLGALPSGEVVLIVTTDQGIFQASIPIER